MPDYVLDTSAILALFTNEPGAARVEELLLAARQPDGDVGVLVPFMTTMEVEYVAWRRFGRAVAGHWLAVMSAWPVAVVESDEAWRREAARLKATHRLSVADAWIASLATLHDATLVHKDPEYDAIAGLKAEALG